ncbi:MAG: hypothetical protein AAB562_04330 [Patescibacteria group bacterium]
MGIWGVLQNVLYLLAMLFLAFVGSLLLPLVILNREPGDILAC